eukprot:CAMPEP_0116968240 /NCGR_PEP_ID=MMETSP0467-20121206/51086_1 /TAXON_ID=283647 /ORGANISM="Mesodinium pulex, Strain SPMC105" /LENGTH=114 /DNA_ID=CAMNT_0004658417 /DNA_START=706 /DNA_END=1050 /DNA_ORIENTATION=+
MINIMMKWVSPVVVSVFMTMEPIYGSIIGAFWGYVKFLNQETIIGGTIMIFGCIMSILGDFWRKELKKNTSNSSIKSIIQYEEDYIELQKVEIYNNNKENTDEINMSQNLGQDI